MYYVLLSGGSGKRLWPLSNEARPKQYMKVVTKEANSMERCSMLQRVWDQVREAGMEDYTVITAGEENGGPGTAGAGGNAGTDQSSGAGNAGHSSQKCWRSKSGKMV